MNGLPADYGPLFIHGSDPGFLGAIDSTGEGGWIEGWPRVIKGRGTPCQPEAFTPRQRRGTFSEGVNFFPRSLASGLPLKLNTPATSISVRKGTLMAEDAGGETLSSRGLVLAMALEQSAELIRTLPASRERDGALALLEQFTSLPCLTVIASYPSGVRAPRWDVCYPEDSPAILLIGNESARSDRSGATCLVCQALPRWSREKFEEPKEQWSRELLGHAARRVGAWAESPERIHAHRWRFGRLDRSNELAGPLEIPLGDVGIWVAGDLFSPGGGIQASWLSGDTLGARLAAGAAP
jgi:predicted NAD/FAD-dependent oxidoreductase